MAEGKARQHMNMQHRCDSLEKDDVAQRHYVLQQSQEDTDFSIFPHREARRVLTSTVTCTSRIFPTHEYRFFEAGIEYATTTALSRQGHARV